MISRSLWHSLAGHLNIPAATYKINQIGSEERLLNHQHHMHEHTSEALSHNFAAGNDESRGIKSGRNIINKVIYKYKYKNI